MKISVGDEFVSNGGRGPYVARVVEVDDLNVRLEYARPGGLKVLTRLARSFFNSPSCGWKLTKAPARPPVDEPRPQIDEEWRVAATNKIVGDGSRFVDQDTGVAVFDEIEAALTEAFDKGAAEHPLRDESAPPAPAGVKLETTVMERLDAFSDVVGSVRNKIWTRIPAEFWLKLQRDFDTILRTSATAGDVRQAEIVAWLRDDMAGDDDLPYAVPARLFADLLASGSWRNREGDGRG